MAGLCALPWRPPTCRAATTSTNVDCADCVLGDGTAAAAQPRIQVGDVISLEGTSSSAPSTFALTNPQLEAKKAMYKMAAGNYDVVATQGKLSSLIKTSSVLMFSLST